MKDIHLAALPCFCGFTVLGSASPFGHFNPTLEIKKFSLVSDCGMPSLPGYRGYNNPKAIFDVLKHVGSVLLILIEIFKR